MKERIQKFAKNGKLKKLTTGLLILTTIFTVPIVAVACDNYTDNPAQGIVDPKPDKPIEQIAINDIWNANFSNVDFSADIKAAQDALCEKAFPNEQAEITNILFDEATTKLKFTVQYIENGKTKTGSIEFVAPEEYIAIRGKDAKDIIYYILTLNDTSKVDEDKAEAKAAEISDLINEIAQGIETAFAEIPISEMQITREKEPIPVETISFDEIIATELDGYLGNKDLLHESSLKVLRKVMIASTINDDIKIGVANDKLTFYYHSLPKSNSKLGLGQYQYKNSASEFENLILTSTNAQKLLDKYFTNEQQNHTYEKGKEDIAIKDICGTIITNINNERNKLESLVKTDFTPTSLATHNNSISQEQALQFALKLGYSADQVVRTYVGTPATGPGFDDRDNPLFETGYINGFVVSVLTNDNGIYKVKTVAVNVPHYSNSTRDDYYRYFLEGTLGERYVVRDLETTNMDGIIYDYAEAPAAQAKAIYVKVAEIEDYDVKLPLEMIK